MIEKVKAIALGAGKILMKYFEGDYEVKTKEDQSPCTIADEEADAFIISELKKNFPEDAILTEESVDDLSRLNKDRVWIADPLDGTKDFIENRDDFCVMIGLAVKSKPVLGVVYAPAKGELYWAEKGKGAFLEKDGKVTRLHVNNKEKWSGIVMVTRHTKEKRDLDKIIDALDCTKLQIGSVGIKIAAVASGKADMHVNTNFLASEWDTCAPEIILEEAGGKLTDLKGNDIVYNKKETKLTASFMAANKKLHAELAEKVKATIEKHHLL